jgi:hypothetical protein
VLVAPPHDAFVERDHLMVMPGVARHHQDTVDHAGTGQTNASSSGLIEQHADRQRDREQKPNAHADPPIHKTPLVKERETINAWRTMCGVGMLAQECVADAPRITCGRTK